MEIKITELKKGDELRLKGGVLSLFVVEITKDWRSGYDVVTLFDPFFNRFEDYINLAKYERCNQ